MLDVSHDQPEAGVTDVSARLMVNPSKYSTVQKTVLY